MEEKRKQNLGPGKNNIIERRLVTSHKGTSFDIDHNLKKLRDLARMIWSAHIMALL